MRRFASILTLAAALVPLHAVPGGAQSEGSLRNQIGSGKAQERSLASAAARLGKLESETAKEVAVLQGRLNDAQTQLNRAQATLAQTQTRLDAARARVNRLRKRLAQVRVTLAGLLRERYEGGTPDYVTVVLNADGFPQLLEE